jgi:hypothetical protein
MPRDAHEPGPEPQRLQEAVFSEAHVAAELRHPPVIVVGLPRSGTKFLTHVLNGIQGLFVFDDLYFFREARGVGAGETLTRPQFDHLLGWLAARSVYPEERSYSFSHRPVSQADVDRLKAAVGAALAGRDVPPHALLEEWMVRYAMLQGCDRWGYKAPQDFLYLETIARQLPGARFIFIYRDPRTMMASYRYVPDRHGRAGRYHPITYALYWRLAHRSIQAAAEEVPVQPVRFEELVAEPEQVGARIAAWLGAPWKGTTVPETVNTSFGERRRTITPTERWICERIAGPEMRGAGYVPDTRRPRLRDLPDLVWLTLRYGYHQVREVVRSPRSRASARAFLARLTGGRAR